MEPVYHGNLDQGPSSPVPVQPVVPIQGGLPGLISPGLFSPVPNQFNSDGTMRYQPEGSSGPNNIAYTGGNLSRGSRPDSLFDPFHARSQPEGARHGGAEEWTVGRQNQPHSRDMGRAQPEGSGGVQMYTPPSLRSPVELRPLSPVSGNSSPFSGVSSAKQSPNRIPELFALDPMSSGILATVELKDTLHKSESSDHIYLGRSGPSHRPVSLPKAISSEYISSARVSTSKSNMLSKAESEELVSYGRAGLPPKLQDPGANVNAKENYLARFGVPQTKENNEFRWGRLVEMGVQWWWW